MRKNPSTESAFFSPRAFFAFLFCLVGVSLAMLSFAGASNNTRRHGSRGGGIDATASGTLTDNSGPVTWGAGPFVVSNATAQAGSGPICTAQGVDCDDTTLQVNVTTNPAKQVKVTVSWPLSTADFDVYVYDSTGTTLVTSSASSADPEVCYLPAVSATYIVRVVPFAPAGQSYSASAQLSAPATPPVAGAGAPQRFLNYPAPTTLPGTGSAGEPSIGVDWNPNVPSLSQGTVNTGGVAFFTADLNEYRVSFDDCPSPARNLWEDVTNTTEGAETLDPIGFVDHQTPGRDTSGAGLGRVFQSQLAGATSIMSFTDDDGGVPPAHGPPDWMQSQGSGQPAGVDHQTVGGGPYAPTSLGPPPVVEPVHTYPHQIYYASQDIGTAFAARSDDGGQTFNAGVPMYNISQCGGLHGHLKVGPDGTVYVPNRGCGANQAVAVSRDNGLTWTVKPIPQSTAGETDPSVGVGSDNTVYFGYQNADGHPHIAVSTDHGDNWHDVDVSQGVIQNCVFPEVVAGDGDRAAFGFLGTPTGGNYQDTNNFKGVWNFWIATTYDRGQSYTLVNATNGDPVQIGSICTGGTTCGADRNLLDFNDLQLDREGRAIAAYADGCVAPACTEATATTSNPPYAASRSALASIIRQSGGPRLLRAFDSQVNCTGNPPTCTATVPGAPRVDSVTRGSDNVVHVMWSTPDNGGSALTGYDVYRKDSGTNTYALIATVTQGCPSCKTSYDDTTATNTTLTYTYKVTALNAVGQSNSCGEFSPSAALVVNPCAIPGVLAVNDVNPDGSDNDSGANTPGDPRVNIKQLFVAEPFLGAGVNKLVFTLQVAPSTSPGMTTPPPNAQWYIVWQQQNPPDPTNFDRWYVAMKSDATGTLTYEYGKFGVPLDPTNPNPNANTPVKVGNADSGSYNVATGVITITLSDAHADPNGLSAGQSLSQLNVRTYIMPDGGPRSQNIARDITSDGIYTLVGNAACQPDTAPIAALSANPLSGDPPLLVTFNGSGSSDPDPGDSIVSYHFDFGDGTSQDSATPTVQHTYQSNGHFKATLTVTDSHAKVSSNVASVEIEVELPLDRVVSEKVHGTTPFDVILFDPTVYPNGNGDVECRLEKTGYTIIYSFGTEFAVTGNASSVTASNGATVASHGPGPASNQYQVHLTGVTNALYHIITLNGVPVTNSSKSGAPATLNSVTAQFGLLLGDTSDDKSVNSADVSQTKSRSGQTVGATTFRSDVNVDNSINSADVSVVKSKTGTGLP